MFSGKTFAEKTLETKGRRHDRLLSENHKLRSALQDIAELAKENGPEWTQRRAIRGLE